MTRDETIETTSCASSFVPQGPTTDNIPTFEGNRVSLEIPDQLFGSSFALVTNISQILGDVILNTARRVQRFVEALKPKFRGLFGVPADAAAAARKRATDDEVSRAQQAASAASDLEELADNQADPRQVAAPAASPASGRTEAFKSLTGLEPFDFDFAALDKLVQSGDGKAARPFEPSAAASDLRGAVEQAGDILNSNLKRVPVSA
ncbi:5-methyltetrahydropteroyltriglutamate--homocysteine methyltransferase [Frankliniella fusca]|uniref:5-methyltetrahydropteroyltriglutamate--homocysteine methyltransferase n=1 Tax=Frankliniella fusca TaxID=407009 RepID=A0AAE1HDD0_9NEOP|nr:5-methyltetrahydropteroyltriglutamate--homocysteine methyltransferase [Frankliniella fusca]